MSVKILATASRNKLCNGVTVDQRVINTMHPSTMPTVIGVIHRLDHGRVLLTTPSTWWQNFLSLEFGANFQREVLLFLEVSRFPYNIVLDGSKESLVPKTSSIHMVILIQCGLVMDRQTYGWTITEL